MSADYDKQLNEPAVWTEEVECSIHEINHRAWTGCPFCRDDEADRQRDSRKEREP